MKHFLLRTEHYFFEKQYCKYLPYFYGSSFVMAQSFLQPKNKNDFFFFFLVSDIQ